MGDDAAPAVDAFEAIKAKYAALKAPILAERAPYAEKLAALNSSFTAERKNSSTNDPLAPLALGLAGGTGADGSPSPAFRLAGLALA